MPKPRFTQRSQGKRRPPNGRPVTLRCDLVNICDGDTVDVVLHIPIWKGLREALRQERIRVWPIQAPERGDALYAQATQRLTTLLRAPGATLYVTVVMNAQQTLWRCDFGRVLGALTVRRGFFRSTDVQTEMLRAGYAAIYRDPDPLLPHKFPSYLRAQQKARRKQRGIWRGQQAAPSPFRWVIVGVGLVGLFWWLWS